MVNDVEVFDPNAKFEYYEVAFAMGICDGINFYEKLDELSAPRFSKLRELLESLVPDSRSAPIVPGPVRPGPPKLSLVWSAPQGSRGDRTLPEARPSRVSRLCANVDVNSTTRIL
jgi:hypothetical protein